MDFQGKKAVVGAKGVEAVDLTPEEITQQQVDAQTDIDEKAVKDAEETRQNRQEPEYIPAADGMPLETDGDPAFLHPDQNTEDFDGTFENPDFETAEDEEYTPAHILSDDRDPIDDSTRYLDLAAETSNARLSI